MKRALRLISEALTFLSGFISRNIAELWFQMTGLLKRYAESCIPIREYLDRIETNGARPFIVCKSRFLGEPGGRNTKIISVDSAVTCMVMLTCRERVACGCDDGRIFIVNVCQSIVENQWNAHDKKVNAITLDPDGTRLVSASFDKTAKVWDLETCRRVTVFNGHSSSVKDVAVMREGRRVISVSEDGTAHMWGLETGRVLSDPFTVHNGCVECIAVSGNGEMMVTGGNDGKLRFSNLRLSTGRVSAQLRSTCSGHKDWDTCAALSPNANRVVSGSYDSTVRVWDVGSHRQIGSSLEGHREGVNCVALSDDGSRISSGSWDKTIRIWDSETGTRTCDPLEGHSSAVTGVSFLNDSSCIVSSSLDGTIRVWDVRRKPTEKVFADRHERAVSSVSFSPDGKFVVTGSYDRALRIWNTTSGEQVGVPLTGPSRIGIDVAVTPDGRSVISVSDDKRIRVWDLESRKLLHTLTGYTDAIWCVAVKSQGDRAVTGSSDKTVRVWNLAAMDGSHVVLKGRNAAVSRVFLSDDGLRCVSVEWEHAILGWELETIRLVKRLREEAAWTMSRREILNLVGETTAHDDTMLSIRLWDREIVYGKGPDAKILATMETNVWSWALAPDRKTMCVGLEDGNTGLVKLQA